MILLVVAGLAVGVELATQPSAPPAVPAPIVNTTLVVDRNVSQPVPSDFLGVNVRADSALGAAQEGALSATPVSLVRWPGGNLSDLLDPLADDDQGLIYDAVGAASPSVTSFAEFAAWCTATHCAAIVTLPGEIDNASYAASIVEYSESTLDFTPAYWEVGNEPGIWTHFGVAWTKWNSSQALSPSPDEYAKVVQQYVAAIHAVEPGAAVIGLPGVGTGGSSDTQWLRAVVALNGPNLSTVAIHVFPAGSVLPSEPVAAFFTTLTGSGSLVARVPSDLAAIHAACRTCDLPLLVDELGSVTGSPYPSYAGGYDAVPYVAAELAEALEEGVRGTALWALQSTYPGSWFNSGGSAAPTFSLYSTLLAHLPAETYRTDALPSPEGLFAIAGYTPSALGGNSSILLVNTNTTTALRVNLTVAGFPMVAGSEGWNWTPGASSPTGPRALAVGTTSVLLPPLGVGLWISPEPWNPEPPSARAPLGGMGPVT